MTQREGMQETGDSESEAENETDVRETKNVHRLGSQEREGGAESEVTNAAREGKVKGVMKADGQRMWRGTNDA